MFTIYYREKNKFNKWTKVQRFSMFLKTPDLSLGLKHIPNRFGFSHEREIQQEKIII